MHGEAPKIASRIWLHRSSRPCSIDLYASGHFDCYAILQEEPMDHLLQSLSQWAYHTCVGSICSICSICSMGSGCSIRRNQWLNRGVGGGPYQLVTNALIMLITKWQATSVFQYSLLSKGIRGVTQILHHSTFISSKVFWIDVQSCKMLSHFNKAAFTIPTFKAPCKSVQLPDGSIQWQHFC